MSCWGNNICTACLNNSRTTYSLSKLQSILEELNFLQVFNIIGRICWECRKVIMKFQKFKNQVLEAQNILYHNSELQYLGSLSVQNKNEYDYKFNYDSDPLTYNDNTKKSEVYIIKYEQDYDVDEKLDSKTGSSQDYAALHNSEDIKLDIKKDETLEKHLNLKNYTKAPINRNNEVLSTTKKKIGSRESRDIVNKELRDKFTTVVFSEDEMIRNREEKRSQPNFKKIPFKCDSCVLGFTRKETYDLHYEKKHEQSIGPFVCTVCCSRFASLRAMESHQQRHYTCYRCRLCKYETVQWGSAVAHCSAKHAGDRSGRIHCSQCGFVAGTPDDLSEHKRTQHTLYCNECGEKFKGKSTLRIHKKRIHSSNRDYICDMCTKTFKTKSRLESHMTSHNTTLAQKLSYCSVCDVQYKNIYVYRNHLKNSANHSERIYHCQECDKRFASKVYLQKHLNFYHLKKSKFKCDICNKLLISDWRLKNHMQTRHGSSRTRNHSCNLCGKNFFTISTLRAHQLTHSTQRSYMCEQCGDTFKQRAALHTHTRALHAHSRVLPETS